MGCIVASWAANIAATVAGTSGVGKMVGVGRTVGTKVGVGAGRGEAVGVSMTFGFLSGVTSVDCASLATTVSWTRAAIVASTTGVAVTTTSTICGLPVQPSAIVGPTITRSARTNDLMSFQKKAPAALPGPIQFSLVAGVGLEPTTFGL